RNSSRARVVSNVTGNGLPRNPAPLAELTQGIEHHLTDDADRARIARLRRQAQELRFLSRLVPSAASRPGEVERALKLVQRVRTGRRGGRDGRWIPETDGARQGGDEPDDVGITAEALRQSCHQ